MQGFTEVGRCKLCKSERLLGVLELEPLPIGDRYVPEAEKEKVVTTYPIDIMMCQDCGHYQNSGYVDPSLIYEHYLSRPATTNPALSEAYKAYADQLLGMIGGSTEPFVVEAGSNDGAFIRYVQDRGGKVLGVEPSPNLSKQAQESGVRTVHDYFSADTAEKIKDENGQADCIITNHTFSNVIDLEDFVRGVQHLLAPSGVFAMQTHYHLDVIEKNLIENFTHEHLSGFYVKPLIRFLSKYGLELFSVQRVPAKGGSIRCYIQRKNGPQGIHKNVRDTIAYEESIGMDREERHRTIGAFIESTRESLHGLLDGPVAEGKSVVGYGTSTGATTFTYNYHLGSILSYLVDDDPYRHNLVSPGLHIPVNPSSSIHEDMPSFVLILAPLYADIIIERNRDYLRNGGCFVKIWPEIELVRD